MYYHVTFAMLLSHSCKPLRTGQVILDHLHPLVWQACQPLPNNHDAPVVNVVSWQEFNHPKVMQTLVSLGTFRVISAKDLELELESILKRTKEWGDRLDPRWPEEAAQHAELHAKWIVKLTARLEALRRYTGDD